MLVVLTATGVLVGLVVWKAPGRAGPDPATLGLAMTTPLPPVVVPGLLVAAMLMLAGGPSLGPENPVIATNAALAFWLGRRLAPRLPSGLWVALAEAATIGALFGTPVAAALLLSEALAGQQIKGLLWDNVFGPLIAAAAGALTTTLLARSTLDLGLPAIGRPGWDDALSTMVIASAGALLAMVAVYASPYVHGVFRRLRHPMVALPVGGLVLGLLGALGGHLTLFKGLDEVAALARDPEGWSAGQFAGMAVVKLAALLVAASCGFRGGRIFPSVFIGAALGLCAHALVPAVQPALGVAAGVLGVLLAVTRHGWLSLFTAAMLAPDRSILALLCIGSLPAWLLVTGRPQMQLRADGTAIR
jgi:H+/Cl- antiporter ClcA